LDEAVLPNNVDTVYISACAGGTDIVDDISDDILFGAAISALGVDAGAPVLRTPAVGHNMVNVVVFCHITRALKIDAGCPWPSRPVDFEAVNGNL